MKANRIIKWIVILIFLFTTIHSCKKEEHILVEPERVYAQDGLTIKTEENFVHLDDTELTKVEAKDTSIYEGQEFIQYELTIEGSKTSSIVPGVIVVDPETGRIIMITKIISTKSISVNKMSLFTEGINATLDFLFNYDGAILQFCGNPNRTKGNTNISGKLSSDIISDDKNKYNEDKEYLDGLTTKYSDGLINLDFNNTELKIKSEDQNQAATLKIVEGHINIKPSLDFLMEYNKKLFENDDDKLVNFFTQIANVIPDVFAKKSAIALGTLKQLKIISYTDLDYGLKLELSVKEKMGHNGQEPFEKDIAKFLQVYPTIPVPISHQTTLSIIVDLNAEGELTADYYYNQQNNLVYGFDLTRTVENTDFIDSDVIWYKEVNTETQEGVTFMAKVKLSAGITLKIKSQVYIATIIGPTIEGKAKIDAIANFWANTTYDAASWKLNVDSKITTNASLDLSLFHFDNTTWKLFKTDEYELDARNLYSCPYRIEIVGGSNQEANINSQLEQPVKVRVLDNFGSDLVTSKLPIPVYFKGEEYSIFDGSVSQTPVYSNNSKAQTEWTLDETEGQQELLACMLDIDGSILGIPDTVYATGLRDNVPPAITEIIPSDGAKDVSVNPIIKIFFSEEVYFAPNGEIQTLKDGIADFWDENNNRISFDAIFSDNRREIHITPIQSLQGGQTYILRIYPSIISDVQGNHAVYNGNDISFTTLINTSLPTVTTEEIADISENSATGGGNVTSDGNASITARGICWSTSQNPTTADSNTTNGAGTGNFTSNLTGLQPNTVYYVRAYATNSEGTAYGNQRSFTTNQSIPDPVITSVTPTQVTLGEETTFTVQGSNLPEGLAYHLDDLENLAEVGGGNENTRYFKGMPSNSAGMKNGVIKDQPGGTTLHTFEVVFVEAKDLPTVTTNTTNSITETSAVSGGNVTSDGNASVTARGICWSTSQNPTTADSNTTNGAGTGNFTSNLTGLQPSTVYYVRAYATNSEGTAYGNQRTFTTNQSIPDPVITSVTPTQVTLGEETTFTVQGSNLPEGLAYHLDDLENLAEVGGGNENTRYFKGMPSNSAGMKNGVIKDQPGGTTLHTFEVVFVEAKDLPTVTTNTTNSITETSAVSGGNVTSDGNASVTARGICWSTSQNPTTADSNTTNGAGTGNFTSNLTGLQPSTVYYVRAYATNSEGTAYGNQRTFTTNQSIPDPVITSVTPTQVTLGEETTFTVQGSNLPEGLAYHLDDLENLAEVGGGNENTRYFKGMPSNSAGMKNGVIKDQPGGTTLHTFEVVFVEAKDLPTVTTNTTNSITETSAVSGGNVTSDGNASVTARGICWSTSQNPTTADSNTTNGAGTGNFTSNLTGLQPSTVYYVRAYATNSEGTAYGNQRSFTTNQSIPDPVITSVTPTQVTLGEETTFTVQGSNLPEGLAYHLDDLENLAEVGGGNENTRYFKGMPSNSAGMKNGVIKDQPGGTTLHTFEVVFVEAKDLPTVTTNTTNSITETSAVSGGNVTSDGNASVTARGICWSTSQNPTTADSNTTNGAGTGNFTSNLTGLQPSTVYYVRAYATNSEGTAYGNQRTFTTNQIAQPPTVTTANISNNTSSTVQAGGTVTSEGGSSVVARGVCWDEIPNPDITGEHSNNGVGLGEFVYTINNLEPATQYYIRAYASNSVGTSYGNQVSFQTLQQYDRPSIETLDITNITKYSAHSGGDIISDGNKEISAKGVCWSTTQNPNLLDQFTTDGQGTFDFASQLTGLIPNTTYYVRAYATNSIGTTYGSEKEFTTLEDISIPSLNTVHASEITDNSAVSGGTNIFDGNLEIISKGVCWSKNPNPNIQNDSKTEDGQGVTDFMSQINGLQANTEYYIRAYAENTEGIGYGNEVSFTTGQEISLPIITTRFMDNINRFSARGGGDISFNGNGSISEKGLCWSTTPNPTILDDHTSEGIGDSGFSSQISGLQSYTTYYVKAYATNEAGTAYGDEINLITADRQNSNRTGTIIDNRDGQSYKWVEIGAQVWFAENLNYGNAIDGSQYQTNNNSPELYCYDNNSANCDFYGGLYSWDEVMNYPASGSYNPEQIQGLCPSGWRIPSDSDWTELIGTVSTNISSDPNLASQTGWLYRNSGYNSFGFNAFPGGVKYDNSDFSYQGLYATFWSSSENSQSHAFYIRLNAHGTVLRGNIYKKDARSVRCIKD